MKILLASAEVTPFAKTGGLADVCGALPLALSELEHEVAVIMPAYQQVHQSGQQKSQLLPLLRRNLLSMLCPM